MIVEKCIGQVDGLSARLDCSSDVEVDEDLDLSKIFHGIRLDWSPDGVGLLFKSFRICIFLWLLIFPLLFDCWWVSSYIYVINLD